MKTDTRCNRHRWRTLHGLGALVLATLLVLAGCDSNDVVEEPQIEELIISPSSVKIAVGEQGNFSAVALIASGDTIRDLDLRWWSTDSDVFTVTDNGTATGQNPGSAFCKVELAEEAVNAATYLKRARLNAAKLVPIGLDLAFVSVF